MTWADVVGDGFYRQLVAAHPGERRGPQRREQPVPADARRNAWSSSAVHDRCSTARR